MPDSKTFVPALVPVFDQYTKSKGIDLRAPNGFKKLHDHILEIRGNDLKEAILPSVVPVLEAICNLLPVEAQPEVREHIRALKEESDNKKVKKDALCSLIENKAIQEALLKQLEVYQQKKQNDPAWQNFPQRWQNFSPEQQSVIAAKAMEKFVEFSESFSKQVSERAERMHLESDPLGWAIERFFAALNMTMDAMALASGIDIHAEPQSKSTLKPEFDPRDPRCLIK